MMTTTMMIIGSCDGHAHTQAFAVVVIAFVVVVDNFIATVAIVVCGIRHIQEVDATPPTPSHYDGKCGVSV